MRSTAATIFLLILLFSACFTGSIAQSETGTPSEPAPVTEQTPAQPATQVEGPPAEYKLRPDDVLRIDVWGEPNLTVQQVSVDPSGFINVPQVGLIRAEGLTQEELVDKVTQGLSRILEEPQVSIILLSFRKPRVYVSGHVNRPGVHEIKRGDRVMEAIAQAGSFTETADLENATITHANSQESLPLNLYKLFFEGDMSQNLPIKDGDTIYVPEDTTNKYFVLGEVLRPGMYRLKKNATTIMEAISTASGPTDRAKLSATYLIRGDAKNPERIKVDVNKIIKKADMSQNLELKPGDVVFVSETSKPDWSKISGIISAIVNLSYLPRAFGF